MKALSTLKSAIDQSSFVGIIALVLLTPVFFPQLALAAELQTLGQQALVFKINAPLQNQNSIVLQQIVQADPLATNLKAYLENNHSPLADYTTELLSKSNWQKIVAISFVESNMCVHHYYYNCSGIGGQEYLRKYKNFGEWIDDMSTLLDTRYNGWSLDKMNGVYVQPKSYNWGLGSKKVLADLAVLEQTSEAQRTVIAQTATNTVNSDLAILTK